ncbi:MAG: TIGR00725 family protein [Nitrospinae bacterium]|nr:TIGR00725 family protein [Nitrospinota bacterium]
MAVPTVIALVGAGSCPSSVAAVAERIGALVAARGGILLCGGLGGVMEAGCRGAAEAGGVTVGLLPGDDPAAANRWVGVPLPTGMGHARNALIARAAHGMIAVAGESGTLSEIALALKMGKPVVAIASAWSAIPGVLSADRPEEAVERLWGLLDDGGRP